MSPPPSFEDRLRAAKGGQGWALRALYDEFAGEIAGFLAARGTPDLDQVVNDTFIGAFEGIGRFRGDRAAFRAWLFQIARHKRADAVRGDVRRRSRAARLFGRDAPGGDAEEEAVAGLVDAELREVLNALTPDQRDVIVLRFVHDLSLEQTAAAIGKPVGAVKALQRRAIDQLRKKYSS